MTNDSKKRKGIFGRLALWSSPVEMSLALQPCGLTMTLQPAQLHETMAFMAADRAEMVEALAIALALESDGSLQAQLRKLARASDGQPFMVAQPGSHSWLKLGNDRRVTVHRERVDGFQSVDLDLALRSNLDLTDALKRAVSRNAISAIKLLDPLWEMDAMPSREQYLVLSQWSPLLEQLAYKSGTRLSILLDLLRPEIRKNLRAEDTETASPNLYIYWSALHVMANLILLASETQCRQWLNDMASQLSWTTWTPTFPLLRERTVWLAACAARSVVAFGEPVVGQYLTALSKAQHPMKAFDALFGLVAIALDCKVAAPSVLSQIRSLKQTIDRRHVANADYFRMAYDDAIRVISGAASGEQPDDAEIRNLGWWAQPRMELATRAALCTDPASFSASGRFVGFSILPIVFSATPEEHYCATATLWRDFDGSGEDIASIIRRAWVPNPREPGSHVLQ